MRFLRLAVDRLNEALRVPVVLKTITFSISFHQTFSYCFRSACQIRDPGTVDTLWYNMQGFIFSVMIFNLVCGINQPPQSADFLCIVMVWLRCYVGKWTILVFYASGWQLWYFSINKGVIDVSSFALWLCILSKAICIGLVIATIVLGKRTRKHSSTRHGGLHLCYPWSTFHFIYDMQIQNLNRFGWATHKFELSVIDLRNFEHFPLSKTNVSNIISELTPLVALTLNTVTDVKTSWSNKMLNPTTKTLIIQNHNLKHKLDSPIGILIKHDRKL